MTEMPMLFTPVQAAKIMNVSRSHVYTMMNKGELGSVNIGRCRRITVSQMNDFIESLTASTSV
jgi:excisionase family DNA binding protein